MVVELLRHQLEKNNNKEIYFSKQGLNTNSKKQMESHLLIISWTRPCVHVTKNRPLVSLSSTSRLNQESTGHLIQLVPGSL